ncbi:sugar-transfer associated ATP-grasp domain-containing protein [Butyricimonas paravirosa]|uniref:sugar-transfer associated ATP-grasp domain-containing protein n=1 Tax=Butyricimonas paravirosa TaxID=1472417 RepID=UPI00210A265F|nr:sugar-transfer associated ATP-grasp domain-containing protein [Butyricimonas paravirosa]MCQ4873750.1 hypothetical protein [Butyricimonas paravirosa]
MIKRILIELVQIKNSLKLLPKDREHSKLYCFFDMIICVVKYGALPEDYISLKFCNKTASERKRYVTQGNKRLFMRAFYTPEARRILALKYEFSKKFSEFVKRDWIYTSNCTKEQIIDFVNKHGKVIIKPTNSTWGKGIRVVTSQNFDIQELENECMIEEVLVNHPSLQVLNPASLQTLRVETCIDQKGDFHLLNVLLMMGTKKVIVSNCHSGGCMAHVNIETGEIDAPAWNPTGWECSVHPSSNIPLIGYKVPMMNLLYEYIKKIAYVMPEARYVGWDVTITEKGDFELIEGNFCPGQCTQTCDGIPKYDILKSYI